jgi:hypothetical protein
VWYISLRLLFDNLFEKSFFFSPFACCMWKSGYVSKPDLALFFRRCIMVLYVLVGIVEISDGDYPLAKAADKIDV